MQLYYLLCRSFALALLIVGVQLPAAAAAQVAGTTLSIDEIYQPQSIIGTTPESYSWSRDGSQLLFLWNSEGYTFRDVWLYVPKTGERRQLTFLGKESKPEAEHRGVSQAVFLDGARIAYTLNGQLFIQDAGGTPVRVEADKQAIRQLSVSPDGRQLAFLSGVAVDGSNRVTLGGILWLRDIASVEDKAARRVAGADDPKVYVQDFEWAKDSRSIAFNEGDVRQMPERDIYYHAKGEQQNNRVIRAFPGDETIRERIGVVDLATLRTRFYDRPDPKHHIWNYGLSSDGKRLFINGSDMLANEHTVYVYDVERGTRRTFYQLSEPKHLRPDWRVAWAPGDNGLIILTDRDDYLHLYHQATAGGALRQLTRGKWEIASFSVDEERGQIYFVANQSAIPERQVYRVSAKGGPIERLSPRTAGSHEPVFSPDFRQAASFFSNDQTPPELLLLDLTKGGEAVQVTKSPRPEFYRQTWANIGYVEFPSHVDGTKLIGRLSLPANYDPQKRYPLIVGSIYSDSVRNQWGGRRAHPTWGLDQYLVGQGYIVLNVNVRGSWGQGREHNQGLHHSYGQIDINDLESGVRHLVSKGYVDPARVGIWGSSYGGLMTLMSLAKKPGVYAAGIAGAPATNVWHAYPSQMWVMGPPEGEDMPARYERQSALYQSHNIRDPLMIIHGTRDPVVLYSDTMAFVERLIAKEQMFELVTLPGANHGWASDNLSQTRFSFKKMIGFFDRHLKPNP